LKKNASKPDLGRLVTEQANPASADLDRKSSREIVRIINAQDTKVAAAVKRALPRIARAVDLIADALSKGGRLIYVGTGTSGRIAALDAAECAPTFGVSPRMVQFIMAGGRKALGAAVEASEDSSRLGRREIAKRHPTKHDVVVGLAASGRTPFTVAALGYARSRGARTIAITCNPNTPLERVADLAIVAEVGPEVVAGSSRMKAGTAQKMILNMLSTGAMARLGYVYSNLMINLRLKNEKLSQRGLRILANTVGLEPAEARELLAAAGNELPVAMVMAKAAVSRAEAVSALKKSDGRVRKAFEIARH